MFAFSCKQNKQEQNKYPYTPKIIFTQGKKISPDSVLKPKIIPAGIPKMITAGKPTIIPTNLNVHIAGTPKIILTGPVKINIPGKDTFSLPKTVPAKGIARKAGRPEIVLAKDMVSKDQNPSNFSFYKTLQGLKHNSVRSMIQDKSGNLWFGTIGGGAARYDGKFFTNFTQKEGLIDNQVWSVLEDKKGNLWFGTAGGGVSCYDGKSFTNFTAKEGLSSDQVLGIFEDRKGNIWFATYGGGASCYSPSSSGKTEEGSFTNYTEKEGLANNVVFSILESKNGNMWFGTAGGVSCFDGKKFMNYTTHNGLLNNQVLSIMQDKKENLWFGTNGGGVACYTPFLNKNGEGSFTNFTEKEGLASNIVFSILEDKNEIWFATYGGGVSRYDGKSFTNFTEKEGLSNNQVWNILEDKSGNIWFGTNGGVCRYDGKLFTNFTEKEGLANNQVMGIFEDKNENIWLGTNGGGVSLYDGKSFTNFSNKEGLANEVVSSILEDKNGKIWFATYGAGASQFDGKSFANYTQKEGLANNAVFCIFKDKKQNIWFGTGAGVSCYDGKSFTNFTEKEGLANNTVLSIIQDKDGKMWFGTAGGGVSHYSYASGEIAKGSFTNYSEKEGLANNIVLSMLQDADGYIWFGTDGGGVSRYDGKSFMNFTEKEGLGNNSVQNLLQDKKGNIWFGTRKGLSKATPSHLAKLNNLKDNYYPLKEALFYNYGYNDGFLGLNCGRNSVLQDRKGRIWWGTDMLTCYYPSGDVTDTAAPTVNLTDIKLYGEEMRWEDLGDVLTDSTGKEIINGRSKDTVLANGIRLKDIYFDGMTKWHSLPEHLSLPYNNNNLTFNFIGVHIQSHNHIKYQYKLDGIDPDWSSITERTEANYGNLPSGNYIFQVKAMNQSGVWSSPVEFNFEVRPPWWQTWWFRILVVVCIISGIWFYIKWRERKLNAEKEILERTVEIRTAEVVEQKQVVEKKHKEISDSIYYAERIQRSLLASEELLTENLKEHFVFFQPKDVVSGDFYWAAKLNNGNFALLTADSTGHGVPGAIMSILNISCIEKAIEAEKLVKPSEILNHTRTKIIETLKKDGSAEGGKDGMDCSFISFDFKNNVFIYSAANNPVWIVKGSSVGQGQKEILEFAPDKMPVGKHFHENTPFTEHVINIQKGDIVYTMTDGMSDQFGGTKGKKFMRKQLKELLVSISHLPMQEQKIKLKNALNDWKGNLEQIDDITIVGIRI
ncbi:MAG: two-component regulator propeller domain-containing protein [Bacteroidia bacterium]